MPYRQTDTLYRRAYGQAGLTTEMQLFLVILSAIAPIVAILWYIYRKDKQQPEPPKWLMKAFGYGVVSVFISIALSLAVSALSGFDLDTDTCYGVPQAFADAFMLAAIPEELAKFVMLWLLLRKNPYYDELFDGIVYAVFVSMGFAAVENVLYLVDGAADGSWISTGIVRALLSVPGHAIFAVLMGYYYSLYHFGGNRSLKTAAMILVAPILAHGIFDGILFSIQINEVFAAIGIIILIIFFNILKKKGKEKISRLMNQ